ncbi:uncharacterized protein ARMOST_19292 [Armillaria ostoyae]|uniref:HNH nuclease domain-containing protein n=1 Tax=Armillaria ostoyae TaxID=47428 RepID=A0A284S481_ARMOS|nr:uncharacterized protein ARMOST_19292 [Armillaria ostoyae]
MPEPLPPNCFLPPSDEYAAYASCLQLEASGGNWGDLAKEASEVAMFKFSPQVAARVLGYALIHSSSTKGKARLAQEVISCKDDREFLAGLAYLYVIAMFRIFKNPKGAVLTPLSRSSSRSPFQATADNIETLLSQPTVSSSDAKNLALVRDNYRCILSGKVDTDSRVHGLTTRVAGECVDGTQLGHIFSQSMTEHIAGLTDAAQRKLKWAVTAFAVVERFTKILVAEELNQNNIHRAENTFTISAGLQMTFEALRVSLHAIEPVGSNLNTYKIQTYPSYLKVDYGLPDQVTLTDATGGKIPLPNRRYFQLHDACAKIFHLSGAGEVVEQVFRDIQDVKVLAEDGGSHNLLSWALLSSPQAQS